jgi:hypothetical protein
MDLGWEDLLKIGLTSGVVTALVTAGINTIREHNAARRSRARDARFLAQRLAVILETFAIECADRITENLSLHYDFGGEGNFIWDLPALGEFPADVDWKAVDPDFVGRAIVLPNEILLARQVIKAQLKARDLDYMLSRSSNLAGECGYRAWMLAADLRTAHGLPHTDPNRFAWHFVDILRKAHDESVAGRSG